MRVLILGINGFIGHHLSHRIIAETDWEVSGMDMQSDRVADLLDEKRFRFFEGDITINREWIEYHVRKCDTVLPLVAIATPATYVKQPLRVFEQRLLDVGRSRCASSSSTSRPTCRSCARA